MVTVAYTAGVQGIDGYPITVECSVPSRAPDFHIVGLPDLAVREARDRVRSAMLAADFGFPDAEILINLAPADCRKEGSGFDLAICAAILASFGQLPAGSLDGCCLLGELSLSGELRPIRGVLPRVLAARAAGMHTVFAPAENAREAAVAEGMTVYALHRLRELAEHLSGRAPLTAEHFEPGDYTGVAPAGGPDLADVRGQHRARRALEIAAAGGHNLLLIGPPGTGKSMLAKRLPSILPPLDFEEALETTRIYSVTGQLGAGESLIPSRPFRAPHHTMSAASLAGGGVQPLPGEISLAHGGVLFLDELPEFSKTVTEVLRQPLEDHTVTISRVSGHCTFPANFMLVCAMNPCKCGYYGSVSHPCTCSDKDRRLYLSRISGPLLDRIDIQIEVQPVSFEALSAKEPGESSAAVRERVIAARQFLRMRCPDASLHKNADMTAAQLRQYCEMTDEARALLSAAFQKMNLSARGHDRLLRVARTIADLARSERIEADHIAEAVQMRTLDRAYW